MRSDGTEPGGLTLRPFSSPEDYEACGDLQEEVWGRGFSEKVPAAILMIANRIGGLAAGAFDQDGILQGFVFGLTGLIDGKLVHWSDMLAVRRAGRDQGLGTRLKLYQREVLLDRGVGEMRWTFDPLQGRNAYVNFSRLGIVCREYVERMYGETDSPLHRGVGTDRLVSVWDLNSDRVRSRLNRRGGGPPPDEFDRYPHALRALKGTTFPSPGDPILGLEGPAVLVDIPRTIDAVMESDMPLAIRWRTATREVFGHYLSRGYEVREFIGRDGASSYLLVGSGGSSEGAARGGVQ